ncbi:hypothetical protein IAQ61_010810 [Plenodomus lingam]|uniref:G-protein coupled receptors family 1 profile domain-containing protein n=1 Tax=Leptosphaeria maculans (strain JN3 / isolate v23.1.3 / race Av1-4-5-6-7-8) TaxID=985895 RepID=E4ZJ32_LEPMJ|nr:hypothetical protein LEMA_P069710.1 [Plenodomus lingam JN3]KAH9861074.1 hypothetical protein IAQ61_010810 [Plenodomus lingam]CBX91463.1 hypothetical protein LEMA_P069710.1 [Plenodomus lingam JN3]
MSATEGLAAWDAAISIPTLFGSLLSMCSTATVILLWIFARGKKRRDFRYALILNLTVTEFMNSLNNSVSGIVVVSNRRAPIPGLLCNINGWAGQFSVVAVDFSVLAITVVTLLTIQLRSSIIYASTSTKALICLAIWVVPLCNSIIALVNNYYGPVSGNWCWIEKRFTRERYALNHGWRISIFFISVCTYAYVFYYMVRRFRPQSLSSLSASSFNEFEHELDARRRNGGVLAGCVTPPVNPPEQVGKPSPKDSGNILGQGVSFNLARFDKEPAVLHGPEDIHQGINASGTPDPERLAFSNKEFGGNDLQGLPTAELPGRRPSRSTRTIDREVWRMLLLNMYPVTYLVLWLPGMLNRLTEGLGHNIRALVILQSSTQFIGFANATVYIYQEHGKDLRTFWDTIRTRKAPRHEVLPEVNRPPPRRWNTITI